MIFLDVRLILGLEHVRLKIVQWRVTIDAHFGSQHEILLRKDIPALFEGPVEEPLRI